MSTKVTVHYVIVSNADGSSSVNFVKSNKHAEIFYQTLDEPVDEGVQSEELEFDEDGELLDHCCLDVREYIQEKIDDLIKYSKPTKEVHLKVKAYEKLLAELDE